VLKSPGKEKQEFCEPCRSTGQRILKSVDSVSCGVGPVGIVAILSMVAITVVDVVLRWFGSAILGTMEITELLLCLMAFFSFSWCYCEDKHIKIEVLTEHFSATARCVTNLLGALVGLVFFGAVMWGSFGFAFDAYARKEISPLLKIPLFPMKFVIMLASCLFFLQLLSSVIERTMRLVKGE
jgi:TRAP-type C4-dicarboxylate transport system permease small subunit